MPSDDDDDESGPFPDEAIGFVRWLNRTKQWGPLEDTIALLAKHWPPADRMSKAALAAVMAYVQAQKAGVSTGRLMFPSIGKLDKPQ